MSMKKVIGLLLFAAVSLVSCEKLYNTSKGKPIQFYTSIPAGDIIVSCPESSQKGNGLLWGDGLHHFFAVYPAGEINGNLVSINIPSRQNEGTKGYMVAAAEAIRGPEPVNLPFQSVSTVLEFVVGPGEDTDVVVSGFRLVSEGGALAGSFKAALSTQSNPAITIDYATCSSEITVEMDPVAVNRGQTIVITVVTLPQDQTNLTAYFIVDGEERALPLLDQSGFPVVFPACRKTTITADGYLAPEQTGFFKVTIQAQDIDDYDISY